MSPGEYHYIIRPREGGPRRLRGEPQMFRVFVRGFGGYDAARRRLWYVHEVERPAVSRRVVEAELYTRAEARGLLYG